MRELLEANHWRKVKYRFEDRDNITYIAAIPGSKIVLYNPLDTNYPAKQPKDPKSGEYEKSSPYLALARLNLDEKNDILKFVNTWGLLGLWNVQTNQTINSLNLGHSERYKHPRNTRYHSRQEPLNEFISVASDYQSIFRSMAQVKKLGEFDFGMELKLNKMLEGSNLNGLFDVDKKLIVPRWKFKSLLHAIYLKTFLDSLGGKLKICQKSRCSRIFISDNPDALTCTELCRISKNALNSRVNSTLQKILTLYPDRDESLIKKEFELLVRQKGTGEKKLIHAMEERMNDPAASYGVSKTVLLKPNAASCGELNP